MPARDILFAFVFILCLVATYRTLSYQQQFSQKWCDRCDVSFSQRMLQSPETSYGSIKWRYKDVFVSCKLSKAGCESLLDRKVVGKKYVFSGTVSIKDGWITLVINDFSQAASWQVPSIVIEYFIKKVDIARQYSLSLFRQYLDEPHAGLLAGILLGWRANIDDDFEEVLLRSGTIHVVAASGYNVTVVISVIASLLMVLFSRKIALFLSLFGVVFYVFLAGANPAIVRAAIMGSIVAFSQIMGRESMAKWILILTSLLMLIISPSLLTNISFQLSFVATAGLIWGRDIVEDFFTRVKIYIVGGIKNIMSKDSVFVSNNAHKVMTDNAVDVQSNQIKNSLPQKTYIPNTGMFSSSESRGGGYQSFLKYCTCYKRTF